MSNNKTSSPTGSDPSLESRSPILRSLKLSDALALAAIPVASNLLIYAYYFGRATIFRFPIQLVTIDLGETFLIGGFAVMIGILLYSFGQELAPLLSSIPSGLRRMIGTFLAETVAIIALTLSFGSENKLCWPCTGIVLLLLALFHTSPLITTRDKPWVERFEDHDKRLQEQDQARRPINLMGLIARPFEALGAVPLIFLLALVFSFCFGSFWARNQREFLVPSSSPESIVLYLEQDYVVLAPYDAENCIISEAIRILKTTDAEDVTFHYRRLGPLGKGKCESGAAHLETPTTFPTHTSAPDLSEASSPLPTPTRPPDPSSAPSGD